MKLLLVASSKNSHREINFCLFGTIYYSTE